MLIFPCNSLIKNKKNQQVPEWIVVKEHLIKQVFLKKILLLIDVSLNHNTLEEHCSYCFTTQQLAEELNLSLEFVATSLRLWGIKEHFLKFQNGCRAYKLV